MKYVKSLTAASLALALALQASPAHAVTFSCQVNPAAYLSLDRSGMVYSSVQGVGIMGICSVSTTWDTITPQACTAWYSSLLAYKLSNKTATLFFDSAYSSNIGATSCSSFSNWQAHAPYFFEAVPD